MDATRQLAGSDAKSLGSYDFGSAASASLPFASCLLLAFACHQLASVSCAVECGSVPVCYGSLLLLWGNP